MLSKVFEQNETYCNRQTALPTKQARNNIAHDTHRSMNSNGVFKSPLEQGHAKGIGKPVTASTHSQTHDGYNDKGFGDHAHAPFGGTILAYVDSTIPTMAKVSFLSTACVAFVVYGFRWGWLRFRFFFAKEGQCRCERRQSEK